MEHLRTDTQIATDIATRAAGRVLAVTGSKDQAIAAAARMLDANPVMNKPVTLADVDVIFGVSTRYSEIDRYAFSENGKNPNAVKVVGNGNLLIDPLFPTFGLAIRARPIKEAISTQTELEIALVMDRSGSMAYASDEISGPYPPYSAPLGWNFGQPVPPKSRWHDACNSVAAFMSLLDSTINNEQITLCTYSDKSSTDSKLTEDYLQISSHMAKISSQFDGGATNIGDGILSGAQALSDKSKARKWATRVMIVLTDGIHNTGTDPIYAAQVATSQEIQIYTITFSQEADQGRMIEVAEIGQGQHYHATNGYELTEAFRKIVNSLPTLITY